MIKSKNNSSPVLSIRRGAKHGGAILNSKGQRYTEEILG